jgi:hypothetical protein
VPQRYRSNRYRAETVAVGAAITIIPLAVNDATAIRFEFAGSCRVRGPERSARERETCFAMSLDLAEGVGEVPRIDADWCGCVLPVPGKTSGHAGSS